MARFIATLKATGRASFTIQQLEQTSALLAPAQVTLPYSSRAAGILGN